jgi:hypothetical protein
LKLQISPAVEQNYCQVVRDGHEQTLVQVDGGRLESANSKHYETRFQWAVRRIYWLQLPPER